MITVISIVNNPHIAREYLLKGLSNQSAKHELLLVNNEQSIFKSASAAYNSASLKATGDYLMFVHQDVFLPSKDCLKQIEERLFSLSSVGLIGLTGMIKPTFINQFDIFARYYFLMKLEALRFWFLKYGRGNVVHGKKQLPWGGRQISEAVCVQTVDELLLVVPAEVFERTKFDEVTCSDWHLYGVDFSLSIQISGYKTYVLPFSAFHLSDGKLNSSYFATMEKLMRKHQRDEVISTTSGLFPTNPALADFLWSSGKVGSYKFSKGERVVSGFA